MMGCKSDVPVETSDIQTDDTQEDDTKAETADVQADDAITEIADSQAEESEEKPLLPSNTSMRDITTMQLVREMGIGINLGNTFEACGDWISKSSIENYEKAWGSPIVTEKIIKGYADAGFGVLRIPVAWSNLMSED